MPDELSAHHLVRRLALLVGLVALVVVGVASLPGLGTLRTRFSQADGWFLALIGLLKLGSCLSNVVAFRDVFCPRMGWRFAARLGLAEQGTNVLLPTGGAGGLALGAWVLRQGGMATDHIARRSVAFFVLTSIPNFACAAVFGPLLLLGVFSGQVPFLPTLVFTILAWLLAAAVAGLPRLLARLGHRRPGGDRTSRLRAAIVSLRDGIHDTGGFLRPGRWRAWLGALGYLGFDIAALAAGYAAFGHSLPAGPLIFAYVIGQLGGLIPLPAGIGGTDGGLIGALVLFGSPLSQAAAADLAYRAFQLGVPAILGTIAFVRLRRSLDTAPDALAQCAPLAAEDLAELTVTPADAPAGPVSPS
jgi:uncharacterized membrane protein YbhN (UPF0104 family)